MIRRTTTYLLTVLLTLLASCSSDDTFPLDPNLSTINGTSEVSVTISTRSTGVAEVPENDNEKIHSWWMVFVNQSTGKVVKILANTVGDYVVQDTKVTTVPNGTYTVYAFANIDQATVGTFTINATCPINAASTIALTNEYTGEIPMSGYRDITVTANQQFQIEVARMYAKMKFQYRNLSSKDITVNSISISQVQPAEVSLMPNYTWLDDGWTWTTPSAAAAVFTRNYPTPLALASSSGAQTDKFYMKESQVKSPSECYPITLNITRQGKAPEELHFLLDENIKTIYRNDYIVVPINITDYLVGLDADFYPPIGGYPAVIKEDRDRDEFYITFKTQGDFSILPTVHNSYTGSAVYYPNWDYATSPALTVTGTTGIFDIQPTVDANTGEITGKLGTTTGTACITVNLKVRTSTSPEIWQQYTRRIFIIRE